HDATPTTSSVHLPFPDPCLLLPILFFFKDTATTEIYTLSLHDALPISGLHCAGGGHLRQLVAGRRPRRRRALRPLRGRQPADRDEQRPLSVHPVAAVRRHDPGAGGLRPPRHAPGGRRYSL